MSELAYAPLATYADVVMGQSPGAELCNADKNGLPFLQGCAEFGPRYPQAAIYCSPPLRVAKAESVLISVRAPVGTMNYADEDYCIGRGLGAFKAKADVSSTIFLKHAVELNAAYLHRRSQGSTFAAVATNDVRSIPIPVFEVAKQKRIATILSSVDTAIQKTEALIAKYQQIKAGLMHDLFTRGVLPNGQLRPPRSEAPELYQETAIGWIPKEWDVVSLASISEVITSGSRGWGNYYAVDGPVFIRIGNLTRAHPNFRWDSIQRVQLPENSEGSRTKVAKGDILISITADLGIAGVVGDDLDEAYVNQHIALVRPRSGAISSRFVGHYLGTTQAQLQFQRLNDSGAKAGLNLPVIGRYLVPNPANEYEAGAIHQVLDSADNTVAALQTDLSKLRAKKRGLMHDLLTGKVQVPVNEPEAVV